MRDNLLKVTRYHLSAENMRIVFLDGDDDAMSLEYNGKVFKGRTLERERVPLGLVVSIPLETIYDLHTVTLSVVVPAANCPSNRRSIDVSTFAVVTTARTSIAGPARVAGQVQSYKIVPLTGIAW